MGVQTVKLKIGKKRFDSPEGAARWRFRVPLKLGRNVIAIQAIDRTGQPFASQRFVVRRRVR